MTFTLSLSIILFQLAALALAEYVPTYNVNETATIAIPCKRSLTLEDGQILLWISPNEMVVSPKSDSDPEERLIADSRNGNLLIVNVTVEDKGEYMCLYKNGSRTTLISHSKLNVIPTFVPGTLFKRYHWNLTIGLIAASVALSGTLLMGLVYQFRWKSTHNDKEKLSSSFENEQPAENSKARAASLEGVSSE